jgi:hypothetical protein
MVYAKISHGLILQKKFTESILIHNIILMVYSYENKKKVEIKFCAHDTFLE